MTKYNIKLKEPKNASYVAEQIVGLLKTRERRESISLQSKRGFIPASNIGSPDAYKSGEYEVGGSPSHPEIWEFHERLGRIHVATVLPKNPQPESTTEYNEFEITVLKKEEEKIGPQFIGELERRLGVEE